MESEQLEGRILAEINYIENTCFKTNSSYEADATHRVAISNLYLALAMLHTKKPKDEE